MIRFTFSLWFKGTEFQTVAVKAHFKPFIEKIVVVIVI